MSSTDSQLVEKAQEQADIYRQGADQPLGGYLLAMATFALAVGVAGTIAALTGRRAPRTSPYELLLITAGTHKLSRTITKDAVTSPLRAPFTTFSSPGGPAEVMEDVRKDSTLRHAVGELLECPFCLDLWIATGYMIGMTFVPRTTLAAASVFSAMAGADFLQLLYARAQQSA